MHRVPPRQRIARPLGAVRGAAVLGAAPVVVAWLLLAAPVLAHDASDVPGPPSSPLDLLLQGWSFDLSLQLSIVAAALVYLWAYRHVNGAHPANRVPWLRPAAWLLGLAVLEIALQSPIDEYEGVLFWVHMIQHMLLIFMVAPLLVMGAPITLALRLATPRVRRRVLLPALHSRVMRALSFPVVAWFVFAGTMWGTHFSPIFDASLREPLVHDFEHLLYVATGMLFWWPVVGLDPSPWRMPYPARLIYVFLQMPQNSFLGLAIYSATQPLYEAYANSGRTWGPSPLADQQLAGGLMWVGGDLFFLAMVMAIVAAWAKHEEHEAARLDAHLDAELAPIRRREAVLAERLARDRREYAPAVHEPAGGDVPEPGPGEAAEAAEGD